MAKRFWKRYHIVRWRLFDRVSACRRRACRRIGVAPKPKGQEDSEAQGFNLVSTLGTCDQNRTALKGRQIGIARTIISVNSTVLRPFIADFLKAVQL
jgi:hypothetical protein